jgi:hypothetical protein
VDLWDLGKNSYEGTLGLSSSAGSRPRCLWMLPSDSPVNGSSKDQIPERESLLTDDLSNDERDRESQLETRRCATCRYFCIRIHPKQLHWCLIQQIAAGVAIILVCLVVIIVALYNALK